MKKGVKWTAAMLICALLLGTGSTLAASKNAFVSVRVEGITSNLVYEKEWPIETGTTVLDVLKEVLESKGVACTATTTRITAVEDTADGKFGGWDGWMWCLGNAPQTAAMSGYELSGGESILLCYADFYGDPATALPYITASKSEDGHIVLTAVTQKSSYDADWNLVYTTVPISDLTVTAATGTYITDENGRVVLSTEDSSKKTLPLQVSAYAANGKPLAVRLSPDFELDMTVLCEGSFTDIPQTAWYCTAVLSMASRGIVNGFADRTFRPLKSLTRAEAVSMFARLSGDDLTAQPANTFTDVASGAWYTKAVDWAVAAGVADGMGSVFYPDREISRQDLAVMLARYADKVMKCTLSANHPAPVFDDSAAIAPYAAEAIYRLQKAGISNGFGNVYKPRDAANRAEFCTLLNRLLVVQEIENKERPVA